MVQQRKHVWQNRKDICYPRHLQLHQKRKKINVPFSIGLLIAFSDSSYTRPTHHPAAPPFPFFPRLNCQIARRIQCRRNLLSLLLDGTNITKRKISNKICVRPGGGVGGRVQSVGDVTYVKKSTFWRVEEEKGKCVSSPPSPPTAFTHPHTPLHKPLEAHTPAQ